jgi:hypothetical protein
LLVDGGAHTNNNVSQVAIERLVAAVVTQAGAGDQPPAVAVALAAHRHPVCAGS